MDKKKILFNILPKRNEREITLKSSNRREEPDPDNCGLMWNMPMEEGGREVGSETVTQKGVIRGTNGEISF